MIHAGVAVGRSIKTVTVKKLKIQESPWKIFAESGHNSLHGKSLKFRVYPRTIIAGSGPDSLHGKELKNQKRTGTIFAESGPKFTAW